MKKILLAMLTISILGVACKNNDDDNKNSPSVTGTDLLFIQKAGPANEAEIELGQVALDKSTTDSVMMFGQMMVSEHGIALNDLKTLGSSVNVPVSTALDSEH